MSLIFNAIRLLYDKQAPGMGDSLKHQLAAIAFVVMSVLAGEPARAQGAKPCERAFISAFQAVSLLTPPGERDYNHEDYCADDEVPAPVLEAIEQLGNLHRSVAKALGADPRALFGEGVSVQVAGDASGPFGSKYQGPEIRIGVFRDWPRVNGGGVNAAVYVHELGHALAGSKLFPPSLAELASTRMLQETIADALALEVVGATLSSGRDLPQCATHTRVVRDFQTFNYPQGYFDLHFTSRRIQSCCDYLSRRELHDGHSRSLCAENEAKGAIPPLDRTPFDPAQVLQNPGAFDAHQLGVPMNSFLMDLAGELGRRPLEILRTGFEVAAREGRRANFQCSIPLLSTLVEAIETRAPSLEFVFDGIRRVLSPQNQRIYDALWEKHAMAKAAVLMRADSLALAESEHSEALNSKIFLFMNTVPLDPDFAKSSCFSVESGNYLYGLPGCTPVCSPAPGA